MKTTVFLAVMVAGITYAVGVAVFYETCNENKCVSRVSKCQLTGACGCTLENCTCCVNCTHCLAELWDECCACVGMCKPRNLSSTDFASFSTIGDVEATPSLFNALTQFGLGKPLPEAHWTVDRVTPEEEGVNIDVLLSNRGVPVSGDRTEDTVTSTKVTTTVASVNETSAAEDVCVVAYVNACLGLEKCVNACLHMGASRYRWFHTGCCECIGHTCLSFGKNKALCSDCPND
ncbi:twisted gastrulation protein homolog 1-B-like [Diadema antillarum]|uniref:twisted gastrulation protein homolog 1-B-like n=1 Tax=Diadema antillarum TaxID=105358 RepID=UPI003A891651